MVVFTIGKELTFSIDLCDVLRRFGGGFRSSSSGDWYNFGQCQASEKCLLRCGGPFFSPLGVSMCLASSVYLQTSFSFSRRYSMLMEGSHRDCVNGKGCDEGSPGYNKHRSRYWIEVHILIVSSLSGVLATSTNGMTIP